jgi:hypothetical protein
MVTFCHGVGVTLVWFDSVTTWLVVGIWVATLVVGGSCGIVGQDGTLFICKVETIHPVLEGNGELLDVEFVQLFYQVVWSAIHTVTTGMIQIGIHHFCLLAVFLVHLFRLVRLLFLWFRRVGGDRGIALLEPCAIQAWFGPPVLASP